MPHGVMLRKHKIPFCNLLLLWGLFPPFSKGQKDPVVSVNNDIFTIYDGHRHYVPDWYEFLRFGYTKEDIKYITRQELEKYPIGLPLLRFNGKDPAVQGCGIIRQGCREVVDRDTILELGYSPATILSLDPEDCHSIPVLHYSTHNCPPNVPCCRPLLDNTIIRAKGDSNIFIVKNQCRYPITWKELTSFGFTEDSIINMPMTIAKVPLVYRQQGNYPS